jgi:alpha-beta hydrolase superfamily lysophospholipase
MAEHSARYDEFADFLNEHGIAVFSHDHRGHGRTDPDHLGYISDDDGFQLQVENIDDAKQEIEKLYPDIPRILFGHSMGSFLVQRYMQLFDDQPGGIIYSGGNGKPPVTLSLGIAFAWLVTKIQGDKKPSTILRDLIFAPYNKRFKPNRTDKDWLNRDEDEVDKYIQDPMAGYVCTGSFFYDFLKGLKSLHTHRPFADHDKEIPILLITGGEDAVSDFGKGIRNLEQLLMDSGVQNVETKIYPGARHEVLKELNKEEVMNDVLSWIYQQLEK